MIYMTFFRGVFGPFIQEKEQEAGPETPLKKSYRSYFRRAQIRWVIWRSSSLELEPDLFSRRFREGISFPNFVERCIAELPLSKLCSVPFSLQNKSTFRGREEGEKVPRKGERGGQRHKGKKDAWKQVRNDCKAPVTHKPKKGKWRRKRAFEPDQQEM